MSEAFTLYKLIVLYMLEKVDFPLTNGQISEFILEKGYTSYFTLQQAISETRKEFDKNSQNMNDEEREWLRKVTLPLLKESNKCYNQDTIED